MKSPEDVSGSYQTADKDRITQRAKVFVCVLRSFTRAASLTKRNRARTHSRVPFEPNGRSEGEKIRFLVLLPTSIIRRSRGNGMPAIGSRKSRRSIFPNREKRPGNRNKNIRIGFPSKAARSRRPGNGPPTLFFVRWKRRDISRRASRGG